MHIPPTSLSRRRLSLTPLIDVIFLLLLFFMLSSTFSRFSDVSIISSSGGSGTTTSEVAFLLLEPETLKLDGQDVTKEDLATRLSDAKEAGKEALVLIVTAEVTSQELVTLLQIANTGPLPVSVARRPE